MLSLRAINHSIYILYMASIILVFATFRVQYTHNDHAYTAVWCWCPTAYSLTVQYIVYCVWLASTRLRGCSTWSCQIGFIPHNCYLYRPNQIWVQFTGQQTKNSLKELPAVCTCCNKSLYFQSPKYIYLGYSTNTMALGSSCSDANVQLANIMYSTLWSDAAYSLTVQHIVYCVWLASTRLRGRSKLFSLLPSSQCHMSNYITITTCTVWHVVWDERNKVIIMTHMVLIQSGDCIFNVSPNIYTMYSREHHTLATQTAWLYWERMTILRND